VWKKILSFSLRYSLCFLEVPVLNGLEGAFTDRYMLLNARASRVFANSGATVSMAANSFHCSMIENCHHS
jgi:hypothetical protein